jgi:hypothetical protein
MSNVALPSAASDLRYEVVAVLIGLAAFLAWIALRDRAIRRRAAGNGAWGAPAIRHAGGLGGERGILLVNDEGIGWAPEGPEPAAVVPWDDVTALGLEGRGRAGLGIPVVPLPTVHIGVQMRSGASRFTVTPSGARSLVRAGGRIPALASALGPITGGASADGSSGGSARPLSSLLSEIRGPQDEARRLRPLWLAAAALVCVAAGWVMNGLDSGRFEQGSPMEAAAWALILAPSIPAAVGMHPWIAAVIRRGRSKGHRGRTLGGYLAFRTLGPIFLVLGLPTAIAFRLADRFTGDVRLVMLVTANALGAMLIASTIGAFFAAVASTFRPQRW